MDWNHLLVNSSVPHSDKPTAAVVRGENGLYYPGVGIENISHPLTITAVQAAIFSCLADGTQPDVLFIHDETDEPLLSFWVNEFELKIASEDVPESASFYDPVLQKDTSVESKLKELTSFSVIPNSDFPVTALIELDKGYIPGVNIECSAWNLGLCAERVAMLRAITAGYRDYKSIAVFAPKSDFISPCGACRQVLSEWMDLQDAHLYHGDGSHSRHVIKHLLPYGFTSFELREKS